MKTSFLYHKTPKDQAVGADQLAKFLVRAAHNVKKVDVCACSLPYANHRNMLNTRLYTACTHPHHIRDHRASLNLIRIICRRLCSCHSQQALFQQRKLFINKLLRVRKQSNLSKKFIVICLITCQTQDFLYECTVIALILLP